MSPEHWGVRGPKQPCGAGRQHSPPPGGVFLQPRPQQSPHHAVKLYRQYALQEASCLCLQPSPSAGHRMEEADCCGSAFRTEDLLPLCPPCEQANPFSSSDSKYCKGQCSELCQGSCWATSHQASPQVRPGQKRWEGNHVPVGSHVKHNQTTPFSVPCALSPEPAGSAAAGAALWCQCRVPGTCPSVQRPELKSGPSPDGKACKGTGNLSGELHKVFASSTEQT